jgi:hypothetical protein
LTLVKEIILFLTMEGDVGTSNHRWYVVADWRGRSVRVFKDGLTILVWSFDPNVFIVFFLVKDAFHVSIEIVVNVLRPITSTESL